MIARHDNLGLWQSIEECARFKKLVRARPLRQIAGHSDKVRFDTAYRSNEWLEESGVDAPEV
jgi:hypothetical protein